MAWMCEIRVPVAAAAPEDDEDEEEEAGEDVFTSAELDFLVQHADDDDLQGDDDDDDVAKEDVSHSSLGGSSAAAAAKPAASEASFKTAASDEHAARKRKTSATDSKNLAAVFKPQPVKAKGYAYTYVNVKDARPVPWTEAELAQLAEVKEDRKPLGKNVTLKNVFPVQPDEQIARSLLHVLLYRNIYGVNKGVIKAPTAMRSGAVLPHGHIPKVDLKPAKGNVANPLVMANIIWGPKGLKPNKSTVLQIPYLKPVGGKVFKTGVRHKGTRAELIAAAKKAFFERPRSSYLMRGDLFEMTAEQLLAQAKNLSIGKHALRVSAALLPPAASAAHAAAPVVAAAAAAAAAAAVPAGVLVTAVVAHAAVEAEARVAQVWTAIATDGGLYAPVSDGTSQQPADRVSIVYQLHNPLDPVAHYGADRTGRKCPTFVNLDTYHAELGIAVTRASGVLFTELNPIASMTGQMRSTAPTYAHLCELSIDHVMSYGASRVIVFGYHGRLRWLEVEARTAQGEWREVVDEWQNGVRKLSFDVGPASNPRRVSVYFSLHPCKFRHARPVRRVLAAAHGVPVDETALSEQRFAAARFANPPVTKIEGDCLVTNIVIDAERDKDRRFAIVGGIVTHNSVLLNVEQRLMIKMAPDYQHLTLIQKVEVFE